MVDFAKMEQASDKYLETNPLKLFKALSKSNGINDLYDIQSQALEQWEAQTDKKDVIIKMPTGSGKTIVGLLIAQASANKMRCGSLYLVENTQLVDQVVNQANSLGIKAIRYGRGPLDASFMNGDAIVVGSYQSYFNGRSRFGLIGAPTHIDLGCIVIDDAYASLSSVRNACSITIPAESSPYDHLAALFKSSFELVDCATQYSEIRSGSGGIASTILEVPSTEWINKCQEVHDYLQSQVPNSYTDNQMGSLYFSWPLLKDRLPYCRALISRKAFTITPYLPLTNLFESFTEASRRVYLSATFSNDEDIIKTFGISKDAAKNPIVPDSLAGIGKRMILPIPEGVGRDDILNLAIRVTDQKFGVVIEVPSNNLAKEWDNSRVLYAQGDEAINHINGLLRGDYSKPVVLVNRYDGVDLPGNSCRLIIIDGIPTGKNDADLIEQIQMHDGGVFDRIIAQRLEQGMGRGSRGASDYCVVLLLGHELCNWVKTDKKAALLTRETQAHLRIGKSIYETICDDISKDIKSEFESTVKQGVCGDDNFLKYCSNQTAKVIDSIEQEESCDGLLQTAAAVRKSFSLWLERNHQKAWNLLYKAADNACEIDRYYAGCLFQTAAAIAYSKEDFIRYESCQIRAHGLNNALYPPIKCVTKEGVSLQAQMVVDRYMKQRDAYSIADRVKKSLSGIDTDPETRYKEFEESLFVLGQWMGLESGRADNHGDGPDVFWVDPGKRIFVIEAKNMKKPDSSFEKQNAGQLHVARAWAANHYPGLEVVEVSVCPTNHADYRAYPQDIRVLTLDKAKELRDIVYSLVCDLDSSPYNLRELSVICQTRLNQGNLTPDLLLERWLETFVEEA